MRVLATLSLPVGPQGGFWEPYCVSQATVQAKSCRSPVGGADRVPVLRPCPPPHPPRRAPARRRELPAQSEHRQGSGRWDRPGPSLSPLRGSRCPLMPLDVDTSFCCPWPSHDLGQSDNGPTLGEARRTVGEVDGADAGPRVPEGGLGLDWGPGAPGLGLAEGRGMHRAPRVSLESPEVQSGKGSPRCTSQGDLGAWLPPPLCLTKPPFLEPPATTPWN